MILESFTSQSLVTILLIFMEHWEKQYLQSFKKKKFLHLINYLRKTVGIYYNYFQSKWLELLKALAPRRINSPPTQLFQCTFITSKYRQ